MPVLSPEDVLKDINAKKFHPVYFVAGEEPYYIDLVVEALENKVVPKEHRDFSQFVIYGGESNITQVIQAARNYPFMAERQLVLVKEAHRLEGLGSEEGMRRLEQYVQNPTQSTVLVFAYGGKPDGRGTLAKTLEKHCVVIHTKKMYDDKLPVWLAGYCQERGVAISQQAIQMVVEQIGNDLKRIHNEIQKVLINLAPGERIDVDQVEKYIGISKEFNVFELQKALSQKDISKATHISIHLATQKKGVPVMVIVQMLFTYYTKVLLVHHARDKSKQGLAAALGVNPFFVTDYLNAAKNYSLVKVVEIIHAIRIADCQLKGIDTGSLTEEDILKNLIFKILH